MKNLLLALLFMSFVSTTFAQIGIKGGINVSNITTDEDNIEDLKSQLGFQAGAMFKFNFSESIALQPEAIYIRKGADYKILGADVTSDMDYLEVPVLLVLKPFPAPISFQVGPQFSYLLRTNVKYENVLFTTESTYEADRESFEDYDLGLAAGVGVHFGKSVLSVRYTRSLKGYEKESSIGTLEVKPSSKHFNLQASIGVFF